jgi:hypothetical protein
MESLSLGGATPPPSLAYWRKLLVFRTYYTSPPDEDGDGVDDGFDQCLGEVGPPSNNGCPTPDTTSPVGSVVINSGLAFTHYRFVTLNLRANDPVVNGSITSGVSHVRVKNAGKTWSAWKAYSEGMQLGWKLTAGEGTKTVYVQYKDAASNVSARASDSITYRR